jgi:hypothetical protein
MMNNIPYLYDKDWIEHEISYYEFNGMKLFFREELSRKDFFIPLLVFQDNNGATINPIIEGPYFKNRKNFNLRKNIKSYGLACDDLVELCKNTKIKKLTIHQPLVYRANTPVYNSSSFLNSKESKTIIRNRSGIDLTCDMSSIKSNIRKSYKQLIKQEKSEKIEVYSGGIPDSVFGKFVDKHKYLAGRQTKSDICWDILKNFVAKEKAIITRLNNDFLFFFTSEAYSYYGISASAPGGTSGHKIMWESIQWMQKNKFSFLDLGANYIEKPENKLYPAETNDISKLIKISFFKSGFSNFHHLDFYNSILLS